MILLGCCTDLPLDEISRTKILQMKKAGFDYVEFGFQNTARLSPQQRIEIADFLKSMDLPCGAMNGFLPGDLPIVGPDADLGKVKDFLDPAFPAAKELGTSVIVFGSGAARRTPPGFPKELVWIQLVGFLRLVENYCREYDIQLAIEPLSRSECNTLNTLMEGYQLAKDANRPHIGLLVDYFHFQRNLEDPLDIVSVGSMLRHTHVANKLDRSFPQEDTMEEHTKLFTMLNQAGYSGGVSVEGGTANFAEDIEEAGRVLRQIREKTSRLEKK